MIQLFGEVTVEKPALWGQEYGIQGQRIGLIHQRRILTLNHKKVEPLVNFVLQISLLPIQKVHTQRSHQAQKWLRKVKGQLSHPSNRNHASPVQYERSCAPAFSSVGNCLFITESADTDGFSLDGLGSYLLTRTISPH